MELTVVLGLLLWACARAGAGARVRLNSVRTVILRDRHEPPVNGSMWERSLDLALYQCMSDLECREGSYCHAPSKGPAYSRCKICRKKKRRCLRDGMCCPGNRCSNNECVPDVDTFVSQQIPDSDGGTSPREKKRGWRRRNNRMDATTPAGKGQVGDPCLRSSDCSEGLCCARHFWTRICKPVLQEGQVCTRHRRKGTHSLELFQRCPCGNGLGCQILREPGGKPSALASSFSASSSLLAVASKSKFAPQSSSSRHSSPHTSLLFSSSSPSSMVAKKRLHVCQRS